MYHPQIEMVECAQCGQRTDTEQLDFIQITDGFDPLFGFCCSRCAAELRNDFRDTEEELNAIEYLYFRTE